mmetsp:Transcript_29124/g.93481  ORF Transcript_29124/g.93481 Transcript_29124/m.93481 type:complete len:204 (-) Transcript_29124:992-1603(-)
MSFLRCCAPRKIQPITLQMAAPVFFENSLTLLLCKKNLSRQAAARMTASQYTPKNQSTPFGCGFASTLPQTFIATAFLYISWPMGPCTMKMGNDMPPMNSKQGLHNSLGSIADLATVSRWMRIRKTHHNGMKASDRTNMSLSSTIPAPRKPMMLSSVSKMGMEAPVFSPGFPESNITKRHATAPMTTSSNAAKGEKRRALKSA